MTRTVRDAALMLDVLAGYDPKDPYAAAAWIAGPPTGGSYAANLSESVLSNARIGVLNSAFGPESSPECASVNKVIRTTLSQFKTGTTLIDVEIPNLDHYLAFMSTYMSRSRYDIDNFLAVRPIKDVVGTRFQDSFPTNTSIGSQLRQPAISVPVGFTEAGLPVGLELPGMPYSELSVH